MMLKFKTSEAAGEHPPASPILNLFFYLIFIIQGTSTFFNHKIFATKAQRHKEQIY